MLTWVMLALFAAPELERGTYVPPDQPLPSAAYRSQRQSIVRAEDELLIVEGDSELVSGVAGQLGLRFDAEENDLADLAMSLADAGYDTPAIVLLFTSFADVGSGGPAYFVPFVRSTFGLGRAPLDQRSDFGVQELVGLANMKRLQDHQSDELLQLILHELAHGQLAYLTAEASGASTVTPELLGRQQAHWHAHLHSEGSVLGGHDFVQTASDTFVVAQRGQTFSSLDLYGLGLLPALEVPSFYVVNNMRNAAGFRLPAEARLNPGEVVQGERLEVEMSQVLAAVGERNPAFPDAPKSKNVVLVLLTAPGETASSTRAVAAAQAIRQLRPQIEQAWGQATRGRGSLCTRLDGCPSQSDAGVDGGPTETGSGDAGPADADRSDADMMSLGGGGCSCRAGHGRGDGFARSVKYGTTGRTAAQTADKKNRPPALVPWGLLALGGRRRRSKSAED